MVEPLVLSLFFLIGLFFGNVGGEFLPSELYLLWLNRLDNVALATELAGGAGALDSIVTSREYYGKAKEAWERNFNSSMVDTALCLGSCSVGLYLGGKIGHGVRTRSLEKFDSIRANLNQLSLNTDRERVILNQIENARNIAAARTLVRGEITTLNFNTRDLVHEAIILVDRNSF